MRRRFLRFLATFTFRYAWLMLPLFLVMTGLALWQTDRMRVDTSLAAFLPPTSPDMKNIREIISDYRKLEPVMVVIHAKEAGHEAELIQAAGELTRQLDYPHYFATPIYKVDELERKYYESLSDIRLIQLLTPEDWANLKRLMTERISTNRLKQMRAYRLNAFLPPRLIDTTQTDPLGALETIRNRLANSRGPTRLEAHDGYFLSSDKRAIVILAYPVLSPENGQDAIDTLHFLEDSRESLLKRFPTWEKKFKIDFEGSLVSTALQLKRMEDDQRLILMIAVPIILLLILLVFLKVEAVIFILLPPLVGLIWALGLASLAFGGISLVTACFLLIILAIGLQYNVHLYHRFILELYRNHNYYRALSRSYVETGRGILASAVVVSLLFFLVFATSLRGLEARQSMLNILRDSRGFGQLGLVAGWGILCNLAACLVALPLLASIKHLLARGRVKPVVLYRFGLDRFYEPALAKPRATLGVMLLVCVFFGYHARELDFYPRFASIAPFFFRAESEGPSSATKPNFPHPGRPIIAVVHGRTWQEALEGNDTLYENLLALGDQFNILSYDSLRTVLPSMRSQKASLAKLNQLDLAPFRHDIRNVSRAVGFKPLIYEPFIAAIDSFKNKASRPEYIDYNDSASDLLISTVQRFVTGKEDGYYVTTVIYPHADGFSPMQLGQLSSALHYGLRDLSLIGDPLIEHDLSRMIKFNLAIMILLSIVIIFTAMMLHFKSIRMALLTFLPVLAEIVWLCGIMALTGIQIHFFTVLVMPLVLCLAMDNALQVAQYYTDRQPCSVRHVMASLGRAAVLTCGIMALLYGTTSLAQSAGLRDFGTVVLYGSGMVMAGTIMLLPALLQLFGRGQSVLEALTIEGDAEI